MDFKTYMKTYFIDIVSNEYLLFDGRVARAKYWHFVLITVLISFALALVENVIGTQILGILFSLALLLPSVGMGIRRLHDIGMSGWWLLIGLVPILGALVLIFFCVQPSKPGENMYGMQP